MAKKSPNKPRWVLSPSPTEPLSVRAAKGAEKRRAAERNGRVLIARAALGDKIGVKARIVWMLWRSGDLEQMAAAKLLVRYFKTNQFAKPAVSKPKPVVRCLILTGHGREEARVPRGEIAVNVFILLEPGPGSLRKRKLGKAIKDMALFFGITENQVRDCFDELRDALLQWDGLITWS